MNQNGLPNIVERKRLPSPTITPQALAYERDYLWMSSRDLGTLYKIHTDTWKIAQEIDRVGGEFNAFTSREYTCFHLLLLARDIKLAIEIMSDVLINSNFALN